MNYRAMVELRKVKVDCCGCAACVQACPKSCLTMKEDEEGFLYPIKDEQTCIDCGLCDKVCPLKTQLVKSQCKDVYAVMNLDERERMASSSGGIFIKLAKFVLGQGGIVFGAVFDEDYEVHHVAVSSEEQLNPMLGSKYLQSKIDDTYKEACSYLHDGKLVLFTGCPCQIRGLYTFLRNKDFDNLITMDFLCHGVPSPGIWKQYFQENFVVEERNPPLAEVGKNSVLNSSLNATFPIGDVKFRDKFDSGWKKYRFVVCQKSASKAEQNTVLLSDIYYANPYMKGFLSDLYLRPSCYECKCKYGVSRSDITIGDYWGVKEVDKELDDDKGVSIVMLNSDKGQKIFSRLNGLHLKEISLDNAKRLNGGFCEHTNPHPKRSLFFKLINDKGYRVDKAVEKCLKRTLADRILNRLKVFGNK